MKNLVVLLSCLFLFACSTSIAPPVDKNISYNPKEEARVRLFGQNNYSVTLYSSDKSSDANVSIKTGGVKPDVGLLKQIFAPLKSSSIGIPKTENIEFLAKERSSIIAGLYYEEFVIKANQKYSIYTNYQDGGASAIQTSCFVDTKFIPEAGKDYEVIAYIKKGSCILGVNNILEKDGKILSLPIQLK